MERIRGPQGDSIQQEETSALRWINGSSVSRMKTAELSAFKIAR